MRMFTVPAALLASALLAGCASLGVAPQVVDGDAVDPSMAYLLVEPNFYLDGVPAPAAAGQLTRVDRDGSTHTLGFRVPNGQLTLLAIPPGNYFVSEVHGQPLTYQFGPGPSHFVARAGRVNYPGHWTCTAREQKAQHVAYREYSYARNFYTYNALDTIVRPEFEKQFPALSRNQVPVYTRVEGD